MARKGMRKYGCVLVNEGDKLTPDQKAILKKEKKEEAVEEVEEVKAEVEEVAEVKAEAANEEAAPAEDDKGEDK